MQIRIIAVGRVKEKFLQEGLTEYLKRLRLYVNLQIIEINEEKRPKGASPAVESEAMVKEGERILAAIPADSPVILLELSGIGWSSEKLAAAIREWELSGSQPVFVIGGDIGVSPAVRARSTVRLSLSHLTFTHPIARLLLAEQIYRAFRIIRGEPYHK